MKHSKTFLACTALGCLWVVAAHAANNIGTWTPLQIKKYCYYRAESNPNPPAYLDRCLQNNQRRIGRQKAPGEVTDLDAADRLLAKKLATTQSEQ